MIKKRYIITALGIVSALLVSLFVTTIILAQDGGEYDPWLDTNEDGIIDIDDVSSMAQSYGSSGDPTKNVNVTNWPVSEAVSVWWLESLGSSGKRYSDFYNASGFGHLHIQAFASCQPAEELDMEVQGIIWDPTHTSWTEIGIYRFTLNYTTTGSDYLGLSITIPVPMAQFRFSMYNPSSTTVDFIFLSFYLTWA